MLFEVNGKPAVKIFAKKITENPRAIKMNCEGDERWFSKDCIKILDENTILIQEWLYKVNFEK